MTCTNHPEVGQGIVSCIRCGRPFCRNCVVVLRGTYYCATCKGEAVRDQQSGVTTGSLELATVGRRFGGLFVDNFITQCVTGIVAIGFAAALAGSGAANAQAELMINLISLGMLLPVLAYEALMLSARGQTLGKMAVGIKVVSADGSDLTPGQAWSRAFFKMLLSACLGLTFIPALFNKERLTLHDRIAGTRVVRLPG